MTKTVSAGVYLISIKHDGVEHSLSIEKELDPSENNKIIPKEPNIEDKFQLWVYYPDSGELHNLKRPNIALCDNSPSEKENELFASDLNSENAKTFEVSEGYIKTENLKYIIYDDENNFFRFNQEMHPKQTLMLNLVDISAMCIHIPPYGVPFAMVYSVAAQEYAITLQDDDHLNGEGRRIIVKPFEPGKKATQYWYYLPEKNNAIMSCAEYNEALDSMMNSSEGFDTIYTHRHHGRNNQQWTFDHRYIVNARNNKVLTYVENDSDFFRSLDRGNETAPQRFCCVPCFDEIEGLLPITDIVPERWSRYHSYPISDSSSSTYDDDDDTDGFDDDDEDYDYDTNFETSDEFYGRPLY